MTKILCNMCNSVCFLIYLYYTIYRDFFNMSSVTNDSDICHYFMEIIKTTRRTGGLKKPYKGLILTLPLKGLRKVCQLHFILSYPLRGYFFLHFSPVNGSTDSKSAN